MNALRLLVTRPQYDGERIAAALRARGHSVLLAPLTRIEPLAADLGADPFAAVLFTSANAVRAIADHARRAELLRLPVLAVGERTADAARAAGFSDVTSAGGDVNDLRALARKRNAPGLLLYLAGEDRAGDLAGDLAAGGLAVRMAVVYRAAAVAFPPALAQALQAGALDAALHFSRRSAELYLTGTRTAGMFAPALALAHYCLSPQVAAPLAGAGARKIAVATRPDEAALMDLFG